MKWNNRHSITLSIVCTYGAIIFVIAFAVLLPRIAEILPARYLTKIIPSLYICCIPAEAALLFLLRMLMDIRKANIFTETNVARLRLISWCFFAICFVLVLTAVFISVSPAVILIAAASGFFGLLLRIIKNVIDSARLLKEENDFTI